MRILLWHGYLLGGTGSNVYTRALARAWRRLGHEVVAVCQEPHPERYDLGGARVVRPDIGGLLPVFVLDRYEDLEARRVGDLTPAQRARFVDANAACLRELLPADLVVANHVLLGAPVGAASGAAFAVKAHGSELEFAMRGDAELCAWARETLVGARALYAGSEHIRRVLVEVLGPGPHLDGVKIVSPGVDTDDFAPAPHDRALAALLAECERDPPNPPERHDERLPDAGNAARLGSFLAADAPTAVYVGKLSREKGVHLLIEALRRIGARAVIAGFGERRAELESQAAGLPVLFTGPLEHRHLGPLLALASASVVPSVFPEAFGMVAAEAASCGCPPLVARHSGLAEIAEGLEAEYPPRLRHLASFRSGEVDDLAAKLDELLGLDKDDRAALARAARAAVCARWSWERVGQMVLDGAV